MTKMISKANARSRAAYFHFLFVGLFSLLTTSGLADERPNILFIAVDDLRPSIGCYDDSLAITPNIDRLAARGLQFDRAYCQVSVCNPSRASLMTGLRPDNLGVWTLPIHFREAKPDAVTLPQWFRKFGYSAVGHGKIYHNPTPDPQSWSEPVPMRPELPYVYPDGTRERVRLVDQALSEDDWRKDILRGPATAAPDLPDNQLLDGARTDMAIADLRRLGKQDQPFFLAMGYVRPHLAWVSPKKYWDMHDPAKFPVLKGEGINQGAPAYAMFGNREMRHYVDLAEFPDPVDEERPSDEQVRHLLHSYYACVSYVDAQIGRMLDSLEEEGLADNTIVVLWSDHGWKLGEYGAWGKRTNYEIDTRVPMIVSVPGMNNAGKRTTQLAELLDLYPTLCDLAGIDTPEFVDGKSLVPMMQNVDQAVHEGAVSQYYRKLDDKEYMGYAIRTTRYRFIEWRNFHNGKVTARELYDHQTDPAEKSNLVDSANKDLVTELTESLLETHPRKKLVMTPAIHSSPSPGRLKVGITFSNQSSSTALLNLIKANGRRTWKLGAVKKIKPGEEFVYEKARIGDTFVVESEDGTLHEIHSPSYPPRTIVLGK